MGDGMSKAMEMSRDDDAFLNESPRSDSSGGSRPTNGSPANGTLIIFDWDDTLLCSTAATGGNLTSDQLSQLEQTVTATLRLSMSLGETMIVTNGNATWVQDSSRRFLPGVVPTLKEIEVISARASYEIMYPGDPFAWKRQAFQRLLQRRLNQGNSGKITNLIVLGDSPAEMEAAHQATKVLGDSVMVKTVKFREVPTVHQLIGQLNKTQHELRSIVTAKKPISKSLEARKLSSNLTHMATWTSSWRLAEAKDWSKSGRFVDSTYPSDEEDAKAEVSTWMFAIGDKITFVAKSMALKF
uniref:Uncharacterized protein n=1 Tax=Alexandrium andersonii TaxID=327968 RepID=A0A7S2MNT6_9DINO|mmetsp:Transcript_7288/g.16586  ORF Transcript_7288/g.16586 Transcript_7288/m.16586 type:complete len:298 (+) Transcript_7288:133-1026(+)